LGQEIEVFYPFHPLSGRGALVVGDQMHFNQRHFFLRSDDGALYLVPAWMTQPEAASVKIVEMPGLSMAALFEVRSVVDSALAFQPGDIAPSSRGLSQDEAQYSTARFVRDVVASDEPQFSTTVNVGGSSVVTSYGSDDATGSDNGSVGGER
jgi:hypothetical protein